MIAKNTKNITKSNINMKLNLINQSTAFVNIL